ncbi:MAG: hypothetical protein HY928_16510 [Elusimicrobia bacterium]|nr:hypothetical protein [Elusimicrobiota bacterium]
MNRGFILVEASVTYVVLALALVALMPLFVLSIRAAKNARRVAVATHLSVELLEEVRLRRFDEATPTPAAAIATPSALGLDAGETAADKTTFDDIDDFNGWSEAPPQDPVGRPLGAFPSYSRTVAVAYVDSNLAASGPPTAYKKLTACTVSPQMRPVCLDTLVTNR